MKEYDLDGLTLGVYPHGSWFSLNIKLFLTNDEGEEYYAWMPFDMCSVEPLDKDDAMQYLPDMKSWVLSVSGATASFTSAYED